MTAPGKDEAIEAVERLAAVSAACDLAEDEKRHIRDDEVYVAVGLIRNAVNGLDSGVVVPAAEVDWRDRPHTHAGTDCGGGEDCPARPRTPAAEPVGLTDVHRAEIRRAIANGYYDHTADEKVARVFERILAARAPAREALVATVGCGCECHRPGGLSVSHVAPCCYPQITAPACDGLAERLRAKVAEWRTAIATVGTADQDAELVVDDFAALLAETTATEGGETGE